MPDSDIRKRILALLRDRDYQPLDKVEMARKLGLKTNQRVALRKELRELEIALLVRCPVKLHQGQFELLVTGGFLASPGAEHRSDGNARDPRPFPVRLCMMVERTPI